jgi:pyruvate-formate lyase-activating enzyme
MNANDIPDRRLGSGKIKKILSSFKGEIVYLSGGEPTLRTDLFDLIKMVRDLGFKIGLFTNGKKLTNEAYVKKLKSNIDFVILQFDTFLDENYEFLRGERLLKAKLQVIKNLKKYKIPTYLFAMLVKGKNLHEVGKLLDFALRNHDFIKIINFNPVWTVGRTTPHEKMTMTDLLSEVCSKLNLQTEDFLLSTIFTYHLFYVWQKILGKDISVQPRCELRTYIFHSRDGGIPITQLVDIKGINRILEKIDGRITDRWVYLIALLTCVPILCLYFLLAFFRNRYLRELFISLIRKLSRLGGSKNFFVPFTSVIVGSFQTAQNVDFDLVRACNLYSDFLDEDFLFSACIRQILLNRGCEIGKFGRVIKRCLEKCG